MILVPLSGSGTRGDQVENARFFEEAGAAVTLTGQAATKENLLAAVCGIAEDSTKREAMEAASSAIGKLDSAALIAEHILTFIKE